MSIKDRGLASMTPANVRRICSLGGKAAHEKGTAHEWSQEEARAAGRKGGIISQARRVQKRTVPRPSSC